MRRSALVAGVLVAAVFLSNALAADAPVATPNNELEKLVPGDHYTITVVRGRRDAEVEGTLVKADERWIVLRTGGEAGIAEAPSVGARVLGKLTGKEPPTKTRRSVHTTDCWVPRDAATIEERRIRLRKESLPSLPALRAEVYTTRSDANELKGTSVQVGAEVVALDAETGRVTIPYSEVLYVESHGWQELPSEARW